MTDEKFCFTQDVSERKLVARNARYRNVGSRSKRCSLPSDYLTKKERLKLNGECVAYDLSIPHTWKEIKHWPDSILKEYLQKIYDNFSPSNKMVGDMLGISYESVRLLLNKLGIAKNDNATDRTGFYQFALKDVCKDSDSENEEAKVKEESVVTKQAPQKLEELYPDIRFLDINMTGYPEIIFNKVKGLMDLGKKYTINIAIRETEDKNEEGIL